MERRSTQGKGPAVIEFGSVEDILKFAIQKEESSYAFYTELAQGTTDETTQRLLTEIAQEELNHRRQLELEVMKMGRVVYKDEGRGVEPAAESAATSELPTDFTWAEAFKLAIAKEQAAYRLYIHLIRMTQNEEALEVFMLLAEEEVRHKVRFERAYETYSRPF